MPNLPTSLILALLAIAWLWVLVPMFARSREAVPETDDESAGFRVLRRAGLRHSLRRHRDADHRDGAMDDYRSDDQGDADGYPDEYADQYTDDRSDAADTAADGELVEDLVDDESEYAYDTADDGADDGADVGAYDSADDSEYDDGMYGETGGASHQPDAADEWESEHRAVERLPVQHRPIEHRSAERRFDPAPVARAESAADRARRHESRQPERPESVPAGRHPAADRWPGETAGPRPHRPGRGGFDPEHARATARYRFRRRRLIALVLVLLMLGAGAGAVLVDDRLWGGLALAGYLTYLRRQVRIERAIAERRMARLHRASQIRPAAFREAEPVSPYRQRRVRPHPAGPARPAQRPQLRSSHVPPSGRRGYTVVDFDDDDPAFDDLERFEPLPYRRAAGQ